MSSKKKAASAASGLPAKGRDGAALGPARASYALDFPSPSADLLRDSSHQAYCLLSPSDAEAERLLPDDLVLALLSSSAGEELASEFPGQGQPLWLGRVWPSRKAGAGRCLLPLPALSVDCAATAWNKSGAVNAGALDALSSPAGGMRSPLPGKASSSSAPATPVPLHATLAGAAAAGGSPLQRLAAQRSPSFAPASPKPQQKGGAAAGVSASPSSQGLPEIQLVALSQLSESQLSFSLEPALCIEYSLLACDGSPLASMPAAGVTVAQLAREAQGKQPQQGRQSLAASLHTAGQPHALLLQAALQGLLIPAPEDSDSQPSALSAEAGAAQAAAAGGVEGVATSLSFDSSNCFKLQLLDSAQQPLDVCLALKVLQPEAPKRRHQQLSQHASQAETAAASPATMDAPVGDASSMPAAPSPPKRTFYAVTHRTVFQPRQQQQQSLTASSPMHTTEASVPSSASLSAAPAPAAAPVLSSPSGKKRQHVLGGMQKQKQELLEAVRSALLEPHMFLQYGLQPPKGALLVGPPGTGKTSLAHAVAEELGLPFFLINGAEVLSSVVGESEARLRAAVERAEAAGPAVLFLDEIDGLCPSRDRAGEIESRLVASLLVLMDGVGSKSRAAVGGSGAAAAAVAGGGGSLEVVQASSLFPGSSSPSSASSASSQQQQRQRKPLFFIGATNRVSALDIALRRPGRFDSEILLGAPTQAERLDILEACLSSYPHFLHSADLSFIAERTHGYVGADLAGLCREAALAAVRRTGSSTPSSSSSNGGTGDADADAAAAVAVTEQLSGLSLTPSPPSAPSVFITLADLKAGLAKIQPSAIREVQVEVPNVHWQDIGGQEAIKLRLREAVEWPLSHPEAFQRLGIRPPKGVLLYGPPGCSKTMLAKAMATESRMNFLAVKGPELFSKYVGDSEKAVAELFARARAVSPCIIFFDEFDALAGSRDTGGEGGGSSVNARVVSQLLIELDGISSLKQVVVVAATNRPDLIDSAILRPGRIDRLLYVGAPDAPARAQIVQLQLKRIPGHLQEVGLSSEASMAALVQALEGYSGAEIVGIFREASVKAIADALPDLDSVQRGGAAGGAAGGTSSSSSAFQQPMLRLHHIHAAIAGSKKQISKQMQAFYAAFAARNGGSIES